MRELAPEAYRAWLEFDGKAFAPGALPAKTKELIALGIAHITQCPWCIDAHTEQGRRRRARRDEEIGEVIFVAMAMASGAAWSHGGLALQCLDEHAGRRSTLASAPRADLRPSSADRSSRPRSARIPPTPRS